VAEALGTFFGTGDVEFSLAGDATGTTRRYNHASAFPCTRRAREPRGQKLSSRRSSPPRDHPRRVLLCSSLTPGRGQWSRVVGTTVLPVVTAAGGRAARATPVFAGDWETYHNPENPEL
jgi:hypothetical protein